MKILIITMNVGRTAPGIVFERLIKSLSETDVIDVVTTDFDPSEELKQVRKIMEVKAKIHHHRIPKASIGFLGINPLDYFWAKKAAAKVSEENDYDLIFSLISFHHYKALIAGLLLKNKLKKKWAVYSVDAIPAPIGWSTNDLYFRKVKKMVAKYLSRADMFFSANEQMLNYQLSTFKPLDNAVTGVIYNPRSGEMRSFGAPGSKENVFLYTGGIYQVRKPDYILAAFDKLYKKYPSAKLVFVGTNIAEDKLQILSEEARRAVEFNPFARNLDAFYKRATALIDIDADIPDDVFLSSKIINYLEIDRIIISETGSNSPSRHLFKGIESIYQCDHNSEELYENMEKAILNKDNINFDDRLNVIELFDAKNARNLLASY